MVLAQLSYEGHKELPTTVSWWKNMMKHTSKVPAEERGVTIGDETSGCCRALSSEQDGLVWMEEVV